MCVEQQGGAFVADVVARCPHIVRLAPWLEAASAQLFLHDVGGASLVAAHRWCGYEVGEQAHGLGGVLLCCHVCYDFLFAGHKVTIIFQQSAFVR